MDKIYANNVMKIVTNELISGKFKYCRKFQLSFYAHTLQIKWIDFVTCVFHEKFNLL